MAVVLPVFAYLARREVLAAWLDLVVEQACVTETNVFQARRAKRIPRRAILTALALALTLALGTAEVLPPMRAVAALEEALRRGDEAALFDAADWIMLRAVTHKRLLGETSPESLAYLTELAAQVATGMATPGGLMAIYLKVCPSPVGCGDGWRFPNAILPNGALRFALASPHGTPNGRLDLTLRRNQDGARRWRLVDFQQYRLDDETPL